MKFAKSWLEELLGQNFSNDILSHQLTMAGLEVDGIEPVAGEFSGIKVGHIVECGPHPDADKLQVTKVDVGEAEPLQIVCGARNARQGLKVAVAVVGAILPGDFKIKNAKLRGVESFGMICSETEMGLSESSDGIMELAEDALVGADIRDFLKLNDVSIDIDLTANRGDCLSLRGIAREVANLNDLTLAGLEPMKIDETSKDARDIKVSQLNACPKYTGRLINNINTDAQTPLWMAECLRRSDIRCIHPVVDITNYVMLLLGQPMHGFDADKLNGWVDVRFAESGEKLVLLDETEAELSAEQLVIADDSGAIAVAGVMGGLPTSVTEQTQNIFLESAFFTPAAIRGQARKLGLNTDSAHRFERGVDPQLTEYALDLATSLILHICGGEAGPVSSAVSEAELPKAKEVSLNLNKLNKLLGTVVEASQVSDILVGLGCTVSVHDEILAVATPSWRFDLSIQEDLIEEVARVIGFDQIEAKMPSINLTGDFEETETQLCRNDLKATLIARDYCEAITYSFIDPKHHAIVSQEEPLVLENPISRDLSAMRTTLLPGLLNAVSYNLKRQNDRLRFFEVGRVFVDDQEVERIAAMVCGPIASINPHESRNVDFFDLKADLEALLGWPAELNDDYEIEFLHPGQSALVTIGGELMGWIGQIHPSICKSFKIKQPVFGFELDMRLLREYDIPQFEEFSKYPSIKRDIALVVDQDLQAQDIIDCIEDAGGESLQSVHVFDQYQGEHVDNNKKSLALTLILQHLSHTLTEDEVAATMDEILSTLQQEFGAQLRE